MIINYDVLKATRELLLDDIRSEFPGVPLSTDHYILAEHRLQTLLQAELIDGLTVNKISSEVENKKNEG